MSKPAKRLRSDTVKKSKPPVEPVVLICAKFVFRYFLKKLKIIVKIVDFFAKMCYNYDE